MENNENLEGKKIDNLEATSASETTPVGEENKGTEPVVELNNDVTPTNEEVKDAGIEPTTEASVVSEEGKTETEPTVPQSDQPVASENVPPVVEQPTDENLVHEENGVTETPALKKFSQEELNDIVGKTRTETRNKTREETFKYIYNRYGVEDEAGLDEVVGNAQRYDSLNEQYETDKKAWKESNEASSKQLTDLSEQVALMQSGIDNSRFEDAKFILKGKGLEVTLENINNELATHPEWKKKEEHSDFVKSGEGTMPQKPAEPETKLSVLGNDNSDVKVDDEETRAMKLFKV